jgi:mono/diheme cytochrome c family protein
MKTIYLPIGIIAGLAVVAACSSNPPASNPDDGASTPTGETSSTGSGAAPTGAGAETGAGGAPGTGGGAGAGGAPAAQTPQQLVASGDTAAGAKLFEQEHCNGCHGTKAKGPSGKFPNLFKMKWDDKMVDHAFATVKAGKAPMPPYKDKLTDKQIGDIVAWVKSEAK